MTTFVRHVLRIQNIPRRNAGEVKATTRAGGAPGTAAPEVVISDLELTVLCCVADGTLLVDLAALFAWRGMTGDAKHQGEPIRRALTRVAASHGAGVCTFDQLLSRGAAVPQGGTFVGPATFRAVVSDPEGIHGFGTEPNATKRRLLAELGLWEMRLEAGLPLPGAAPVPAAPAGGAAAAETPPPPATPSRLTPAQLTPAQLTPAQLEAKNWALQQQICAAVSERFGKQVAAEAGATLFQVVQLVLLGAGSVSPIPGRQSAPRHAGVGDNSSDSEDEFFDANERPSEADAGALADQESGDSSESSIVVIEELADGLADMLTRNTDVCAALAPEFLKETIAQFATHGSKLRRARTGCGMAIKLEMNLSAEQVDLLNEICAPIAEELGVPGLKLFASSWQIKGELDTFKKAWPHEDISTKTKLTPAQPLKAVPQVGSLWC